MATLEEQMKKVQDKIEGLQEEIKAVKLLPEGHLERPLLMELNKQLTELNKQLSVLQERLLLKERAASQPQAAPIGITVALPRMDEDRQVVLRPVQQKEFRDSADFDTWLNKLELQGLEDEDGILVTSFDELKAGCTYTGVLRPSSGALSSLSGADRARINAAEQEFQEGLIPLVAKEEGVSPDQVTLLPEARQVFEELDGHRTAVLELDAVLYVQKPGQQDCVWLGSHKLLARGFQPVGELVEAANDMEAYVKDPMKYPATKSFKGCNNFKKAFYAEYYEVPHGIKYQRFKEKCIKSGVTLVKKSGSGLVKARLV